MTQLEVNQVFAICNLIDIEFIAMHTRLNKKLNYSDFEKLSSEISESKKNELTVRQYGFLNSCLYFKSMAFI